MLSSTDKQQLINSEGIFCKLIAEYGSASSASASDTKITSRGCVGQRTNKQLLEEDRMKGHIDVAVYKAMFKAAQSPMLLVAIALTLGLGACANIGTSLWLSFWSQQAFLLTTQQYIAIYAGE